MSRFPRVKEPDIVQKDTNNAYTELIKRMKYLYGDGIGVPYSHKKELIELYNKKSMMEMNKR